MKMRQGYFFVDWPPFGDYFDEVKPWTDLHWVEYGPDLQNPIGYMKSSARRAAESGYQIHLSLFMDADPPLGVIFNQLDEWWSAIRWIELGGEVAWNTTTTESMIKTVKAALVASKLPIRPLGIVHNPRWFRENRPITNMLDWVGIETYMDPSIEDAPDWKPRGEFVRATSDPNKNRRLLVEDLDVTLETLPTKIEVVAIGQGYTRNGAWKNMTTLVALQHHTFEWAQTRGAAAINWFAYARASGTKEHRRLKEAHQSFWKELHPADPPPPPPPPPPDPPPVPPPTPPPAKPWWFQRFIDWILGFFR